MSSSPSYCNIDTSTIGQKANLASRVTSNHRYYNRLFFTTLKAVNRLDFNLIFFQIILINKLNL